jgi:hypothetical protein
MASKLNERDKQLLNAFQTKRVGEKPYENGLWGTQGHNDFAYLEIYDDSNNLIDFTNLPSDKFINNADNGNIEFYVGNHLRELGFNNGIFNVNYNFFRKLAGDERAVLVRNKAGFEGDVYTANFNIQPDGKVYTGTEESFRSSPGTAEQLSVEDLKYSIDTISPNRTEVRLKAKNIKGSYTDDFINIQTAVTANDIEETINFVAPDGSNADLFESNVLNISPAENGFLFTQKMKNGTITIPNVFLVNEVQTPVKTGINFITNPDLEITERDSYGNEVSLANYYGWDASLHSKAVRVDGFSPGYNSMSNPNGVFAGTAHLGYHAHFVRGEGVTGGVCMKFPDQNEIFRELDEWPTEYASRWLGINQKMGALIGQGVKHFDFVNLTLDLKASVAGRGILVSLYYPNELITENIPDAPPIGYYNPNNPPPGEEVPNDPPQGYIANTASNASDIEDQPPSKYSTVVSLYLSGAPEVDISVGDSTTFWGGEGAWIITQSTGGQNPIFTWSPNLVGVEYSKAGTLSLEQEWKWDGTAWGANPDFFPSFPTAPVGTVNDFEYPEAVNTHPYQLEGQGTPRFKRDIYPGENRGWQTGTTLDGEDTKMTTVCGVPAELVNNNAVILIKNDLVWVVGDVGYTTNKEKIGLTTIDTMFPQLHSQTISKTDSDGNQIKTHTVYNDIFEHGRIQSITRTRATNNDHNRDNFFVLFYTDGRGNEDSNKVFMAEIGAEDFVDFFYLKDLDGAFNDTVNAQGGEMEWAFSGKQRSGGTWHHYACVKGTNKRWRTNDGDGDIFSTNQDTWFEEDENGEAGSFSNGFAGVDGNYFDVWFSQGHTSGHFSNYSGIYGVTAENGGQWINLKEDESEGVSERFPVNEYFYGAGEVGSEGIDLTFGSRNPGADNYGIQNEDGEVINVNEPYYDNGSSVYSFDPNPTKDGTLSPGSLWKWNGVLAIWEENVIAPPRYSYAHQYEFIPTDAAGKWETKNVEILIPNDWILDQDWYIYFYGHIRGNGNQEFGITWVDNLYMDFTLVDESVTQKIYRPFTAQIEEVSPDGLFVTLDRSYKQNAIDIGVEDDNPDTEVYDIDNPPDIGFPNFRVTYLNLNPLDLRTYLKFNNQLFLTTNFKQDKINVSNYPHAVVYKLYEPLPDSFAEFDECIIVKEMAEPVVEKVKILDFIPAEEPQLVLKSPDLKNVESPIRGRKTDFKNENEILTDDVTISTELKNEFLSQSIDSVELNIDHSRYENFIKFSSVEKRIRNFKLKLKQIEDFNAVSSSFIGISGSDASINAAEVGVLEVKNNFDQFEKYMYYQSSSYSSASLGIEYDNAWPKASGEGNLRSPYVLETTNSTNGIAWFNKAITSGSLYDEENSSKLSSLLPQHIIENVENDVYLKFIDMIGQHFDSIWVYINGITDTFDRREKLTEGISKDLLYSVGRSLGWNLDDGKDLIDLPRYALGKEVTGSAYSDYSATSERDISREIWSRIINNMPFFLKNKGTIRALKGLINIYGIPSTILRVKEYGGPNLPDDASPEFEVTKKFTKALDFKGNQYVKVAWADDTDSGRKPDTIEFRFRAVSSSNQILVNKDNDFIIRLKDNDSVDDYGSVAFMLSGSGGYDEIESTSFPIYDGDFYSVMLARKSGSNSEHISQSYELNVGKYDSSRSKINLFSSTTMLITGSSGDNNENFSSNGDIYIGGETNFSSSKDGFIGAPLTGSIMEYRHWTETLNTSSFKNHIANPKAYDGNSVSSSYENLVLRYSMNDNKDLSSDTEGIRDVSSNQTSTLSGSHSGFTGNFFRSVVDEQKSFIPSIGALRRTTNKIRVEDNPLKPGEILSRTKRSTSPAYDNAPLDSNKVGIFFAPTDVVNNDIINSVGNMDFNDYLGDPRDLLQNSYRGLERVTDIYWKKYTSTNNFWDYMRLIKYYDQSLYPQLRKMIPARAKPDIGLLIEPNIFERPKVVVGKKPEVEDTFFTSSIDIGNVVDGLVVVTGSFNAGASISKYDAYDGEIQIYGYSTESIVISSSGENLLKEASASLGDGFVELSMWQRINKRDGMSRDKYYATASIQSGDIHYSEVFQPVVTGSRIYGRNQQIMPHYSSSLSASLFIAYSSSLFNVDLDNQVEQDTALFNRVYAGVKNTKKTTIDGGSPVEIIITAPSKLVTTKDSDSTLKTGEGIVSEFKEKEPEKDKFDPNIIEEPQASEEVLIPGKPLTIKGKKLRGLKGLAKKKRGTPEKPITDAMIIRETQEKERRKIAEEAKFESSPIESKGKAQKKMTIKGKKSKKQKKK